MFTGIPKRSDPSRLAILYWRLRDANTKTQQLEMARWMLELNALGYVMYNVEYLPPMGNGKVRVKFRLSEDRMRADTQWFDSFLDGCNAGMTVYERIAWAAWRDDPVRFSFLLDAA